MSGRKGRRRSDRLIRTAICIGLVGVTAAFAQSEASAFERPATAVQTPVAPVWKTVTLGTRKGVDSYRDALEKASIKIGDDAGEILGRPAFPYAHAKIEYGLVLLSVAELAVDTKYAPLSDVYSRARRLGLDLCPAEVGPQLRLEYRNQPRGEILHIAMQAVATYHGRLSILALSNFGGTVALIGSDGRPSFMAPRFFRFVFTLPAKQPLEVVKNP
jgi:hypothetical protein